MQRNSRSSKIRKTLLWLSLFCFPLTLNYFSPVLSLSGAFQGVITGSVITFAGLLITGVFMRRAWCGWLCPGGAIGELCRQVNDSKVNAKRLKWVRYSVFAIWFSIMLIGFFRAGGVQQVSPFFMTERYIAVDSPEKFFIYYLVVGILFVLDMVLGSRGACHSICWMSPFLVAGAKAGQIIHAPQLMIGAREADCIHCGKCSKTCQMSIDVMQHIQSGQIKHDDCILCGECIDVCPKQVLSYRFE
ncbi:4Fe-4S binding protein [Fusibacter paucivorans]|uniref:4Fe-4S binding protein n=1 Tax=Fusibacter paucivorans TaxID=76009 RepID=A0ABS5PU75_9FIRM|nr:4Fe-4S binding protein [Fusibacter paucivorans]MBS7527916.1 4Fe-4S binding protein [Fusibacter paucivorans]